MLCLALLTTSCTRERIIEVTNTSELNRDELVEIDGNKVAEEYGTSPFVLTAADGTEIPYQLTYDGKLIFPLRISANSTAIVRITAGTPVPVDTLACGAFYPERMDDLAWENDCAAYRAYGPALQAANEHAYGYDIWTKSTEKPVVKRRYRDALMSGINFHEDHGDGMDAYTVGPTLGAGTAALIDSLGNIEYPWCFSGYEILDNGPLRFTVRLTYDSGETRLISLDAGEYLNRTEVCFKKAAATAIAPGIVIHRQNPEGYVLSPENGYMAYADLSDNADNGNGVIYVGVVAPDADSMMNVALDVPAGDALGHILAKSPYKHGDCYVYYWGSGWSKGAMPDMQSWKKYLTEFSVRLANPLKVEIKN